MARWDDDDDAEFRVVGSTPGEGPEVTEKDRPSAEDTGPSAETDARPASL